MISVSSHLLPHNSGRQCLLPIENLHVQNLQVSNMTAHVWDFLEQEPVSSSTLHEHNHRKAITENQTLGKKEVQTHRENISSFGAAGDLMPYFPVSFQEVSEAPHKMQDLNYHSTQPFHYHCDSLCEGKIHCYCFLVENSLLQNSDKDSRWKQLGSIQA